MSTTNQCYDFFGLVIICRTLTVSIIDVMLIIYSCMPLNPEYNHVSLPCSHNTVTQY